MKSIRASIIIGILIGALLFVSFIYPGLEYFNLPPFFTVLFRIAIFIALSAYIVYIIQEVYQYFTRWEIADKALQAPRLKAGSDEEFVGVAGLKLRVDPNLNYQEILRQLLHLIQSSLVSRTAFLCLYNPATHTYLMQDFITGTGLELVKEVPATGTLFSSYHLNPRAQILTGDKLNTDALIYYQEAPRVGTLMIVPILTKGANFIGIVGLDSIDRNAWSQDDIELVRAFVEMFNAVTWQIDVIDQQKMHIQFFRDLCRLNNDLSIGTDPLALFKEASQVLKRFFQFEKLTFAQLKDDESEELIIQFVDGQEADYSIGHQITVAGGLWERLLTSDTPILIEDYEAEAVNFRFQPNDLDLFPFRSAIGATLEVGRKRLGGILLESYRPHAYDTEAKEILNLFARNIGGILNRIQSFNALKELALIDGLTGIYNHRAFKERLQNEIERCKRYNTTLTLLILDLDKFKRINDTYGHLCGDFVLKKTANIIRGSIRTIDVVARYGGEEFAVILINADKNGCYNTAERIRSNIQSYLFSKDNMQERMTISVGMAEFPIDAANLGELINAADMAMYNSKRLGGNKITLYQSNPTA